MSEIPFVRTGYAKTLFEKQIPELLEGLREINGSLKSIAGPNGGGPIIGSLRAAVSSLSAALATAVEPHDDATREAATKAEHALGFALDDLRRLSNQVIALGESAVGQPNRALATAPHPPDFFAATSDARFSHARPERIAAECTDVDRI